MNLRRIPWIQVSYFYYTYYIYYKKIILHENNYYKKNNYYTYYTDLDDSKFSGGQLSSTFTHQLALIYRLSVSMEDAEGDELVFLLYIAFADHLAL